MNTPSTFRLSADFPHGVLPEVFGVITAADPKAPGAIREANGLPGMIPGDALRIMP